MPCPCRANPESSGFGYHADLQSVRQVALSVALVVVLAVAIVATVSLNARPASDLKVSVAVSFVTQPAADRPAS